MELSQILGSLAEQFAEAGIESARADAEILVAHILGMGRGELGVKAITGFDVPPSQLEQIRDLASKRAERVPLQHLTGVAHFRNLELQVGPGVFVPRPETEGVAQVAIDALKAAVAAAPGRTVIGVDLATGSGAIALAMATEVQQAQVYAVELSEDALAWTRKNFAACSEGLPHVPVVRQGDLADAFADLNGRVNVLISNPPYIPNEMIPIYPEVHLHDPKLALYGGTDGLDLVRKVSQTGLRLVVPGGTLVVEHADIQSQAVVQLLLADGWKNVQPHLDFNQRPRCVSATR